MVRCATESLPSTQTGTKTRTLPQYKVILLNDPVTTFDFVTELLINIFHKPSTEARALTLEVHERGSALITVTSLERAELYVEQVRSLARPRGYPLSATIEPA
jgi:ATP-dependent Clp protease adaptor protein ClpS